MAIQRDSAGDTGSAGQLNGAQAAGEHRAATHRDAHTENPTIRDHAGQLTDAIASGLKQHSRSESVIVGGIRQRAELYEKAYVHAKQVMINALEREAEPADRRERADQVLRKVDADVLPPETIGNLAALDARHYGKLHDPQRRAEATLGMAETAHLSVAYRAALAATAPDVAAAVRNALATRSEHTEFNLGPADMLRGALPNITSTSPTMALDVDALERVAANRTQDAKSGTQQVGLNSIEPISERKEQGRRQRQIEESRAAPKRLEESRMKPMAVRASGNNQVISDEVFTASKDEVKPIVPAVVEDRFLRVGNKFYHPRNTTVVAFEDKGNKLQTQSNSEQIAEVMVSIARARGWDEIKVTGSETFRREVWLEAAAHGMHVKGYKPSAVDKAALAQRTMRGEGHHAEPGSKGFGRDAAQAPSSKAAMTERMAKTADRANERQPNADDKQRAQAFAEKSAADAILDHPELAGTYAVMTSIRKKATADRLTPQQRAVVMARVATNLVESIERGELPEVKVRERAEVRDERRVDRKVTR